ncbi:MAG TPA: carboxypeptidase-like regulatory domain-containing protein, partial [Aggregicoccus sp.]|nr:carboxypeptidase-like regulatory domain-containing protein [Aggregicoccus sp.]
MTLLLLRAPAEPSQVAPAPLAAGLALQAERAADLDVRGSAEAGSTPSLSEVPAPADGALAVEVLAGERALPGASVRLYWRGPRDANTGEVAWRLASAGTTDAAGLALLPSRPAAYRVVARAEGFAPAQQDVVRPYGEARTPLRLSLHAGQRLSGRTVVKGSGDALPQVQLVLTAHGRALEAWEEAHAPAEERVYGESDARGHFALEGLAPGDYALEARAPGHAQVVQRRVHVPAAEPLLIALPLASVIEGFVVDAEGRGVADAQVQVAGQEPQVTTTGEGGGFSVEVEAGPHLVSARKGALAAALPQAVGVAAGATVRDVRLQLGAGGVLEGRVVARAGGRPVAGASVDLSPAGQSGDSGRARTDAQGAFRVEALAPGSYDLVVSAPGFSESVRRGLTLAAGECFPVEVLLAGTGAVQGVVRDGEGRPLPGVRVKGGSRWGGGLGTQPAEALTDGEGRYRLVGLEAGHAYLTARRDAAALGTNQPVQVKEGETAQADFVLEALGWVEGRVRTPEGRVPTASLSVRATRAGHAQLGLADLALASVEQGRFALALPAGSYRLRLAAAAPSLGFFAEQPSVTVEAGRTVQVELTHAQAEARLHGFVLEPGGAPSAGAELTLALDGGRSWMGFLADGEGRFSVTAQPGVYGLSASNGGRSGSLQGLKPGPDEVVLQLKPAASVRGRVVRASGAPVRGFHIRVAPTGPVSFGSGTR